mmetsp:Transcript_1432/g.5745  ORF Transcript_1432/g.5745 Transcript_1432/m.5745 type:complete len:436 (+) Transcript_1432:90-1397(+)
MGAGAGTQSTPKQAAEKKRACMANLRHDYAGDMLLAADVGGTSSRMHLFLPPGEHVTDVAPLVPPNRMIYSNHYSNNKFDTFTDVVRTFLKEAGMDRPPRLACFAVAGVVVEGRCNFVNRGWVISARQMEVDIGIEKIELINDFAAQGYGIISLDPKTECDTLQNVKVREGSPIAIIGAGTGLGEAFATLGANGDYEVWPSEGGHTEFAPRAHGSSQLEYEMIQYLQVKYSARARISVERVVSGQGLSNIYEFLAWKFPEQVNQEVHRRFIGPVEGPRTFDPSVITQAAQSGDCELSARAVELWCGAYGSEAGVVALKYMPFGGLYITGGVTNKMRDFITGQLPTNKKHNSGMSPFMESFFDKGRVTTMLMRVPVFLVRGEDMGERGVMIKAQRQYLESKRKRASAFGAPGFGASPKAVTQTSVESLDVVADDLV